MFTHLMPQSGGWKPFLFALFFVASLIAFELWLEWMIGPRISSFRTKMFLRWSVIITWCVGAEVLARLFSVS